MRWTGFGWLFVAAALGLLSSGPARAGVWMEAGDAPALLPGEATYGLGSLDMILGTWGDTEDVDLYLIRITDPATFSALVESGDDDPQVFLFDAQGFGIAGDDDQGFASFNSSLPQGNSLYASRPAGLYLLGVSVFDADPLSSGGLIFPDNFYAVVGPTGPGGGSPLNGWNLNVFSANLVSSYAISLTGASFVPEPRAAVLAAAAALTLLALLRWRERARRP
jgi:hypothetical protein